MLKPDEFDATVPAVSIEKIDGGYEIFSSADSIKAGFVVNAAGMFSDNIAALVGDKSFKITPRMGEYILLDKECGDIVAHTIFRTPSKMGKGIYKSWICKESF